MSARRFLVPLDGSKLAERTLEQLERFFQREEVEVVLFHAMDPRVEDLAAMERAARDHLEPVRARLEERGIVSRIEVSRGDAAEEIGGAAERNDASLVAMSSHGRTGATRLLRGSVAERVLRSCRRPVLVTSCAAHDARDATGPFERILVPLDGSEASARIVPVVEELARVFGSEVLLLRIEWALSAMVGPFAPDVAKLRPLDQVAADLAPVRSRLEGAGVRARVIASYGPEATEILDCAERNQVGLIAMSTHGRSGVSRWALGSVAEHVLRHCACPVLVRRVPPGQVTWVRRTP